MQTYNSMFSYSTTNDNLASSSSTNNNNFPFLISQLIDYENHHGLDQFEPLISGTTMYDDQALQLPRVQSQPLITIGDDDVENRKTNNSKNNMEGKKSSNNNNNNSSNVDSSNKGKKMKKHRYAFQTRSQVDILDDGYRWRKYGQKAVKNNKFPRSYYRCTQQGCNVKKQVQRLTKDEGVVVTTYEGVHSHSIDTPTDNFEHILSQMQIYTSSDQV